MKVSSAKTCLIFHDLENSQVPVVTLWSLNVGLESLNVNEAPLGLCKSIRDYNTPEVIYII